MDQQNIQHYYQRERERFEGNGASKSPEWMKHLRTSAFDAFATQGFPGTDREEWRFTNIAPMAREEFACAQNRAAALTQEDIEGYRITADEYRFTFVNGYFVPQCSHTALPKGTAAFTFAGADAAQQALVKAHLARQADYKANAFAALNTAFVSDGVFIRLSAGTTVDAPIHILNVTVPSEHATHTATYPRLIIVADEGASATIIETYASAGREHANLTNAVTEMMLHPGSHIQYVKLQDENDVSYHMHGISVTQQQRSVLNMFSLALGGSISRSEVSVLLEGEQADCNLNGLYIGDGSRLTDHHTFIHHKYPECTSHELFKGILDGNARGVYSGKVYVDAVAQKTDSKQTNRNLMLSETATIDTKPQLEIFADDVKCTHGAAVGGLNEQTIFYLKSRGVGAETARAIVTVGFAAEATGKIPHEPSRRRVDELVVAQLRKRLGALVPEIVHSGSSHEEA